MSKPTFTTPGPWEVLNTVDIFTRLGAPDAFGTNAPSNDGWHIADCDMGGLQIDEVRANAHLIAAAPDLYEALDSAHKLICEGAKCGFNPMVGDWAEKLYASNGKSFDALAKARGEKQ